MHQFTAMDTMETETLQVKIPLEWLTYEELPTGKLRLPVMCLRLTVSFTRDGCCRYGSVQLDSLQTHTCSTLLLSPTPKESAQTHVH